MKSRVVFLGSDGIALPLLEWLAREASECVDLCAVYTQPDRPVGRGQKVQPNAIKLWALARGLPVFQPERLGESSLEQLAGLKADLGLVMAYGHILRDNFINCPRLGMVNLHASVLPALRGASPIQTAVATAEAFSGVSLMRIVRELDAGPVADVEKVPIGPRDTALEVEQALAQACVPLVARNLAPLLDGTLTFHEQDRQKASFCRKLSKEDAVLDFSLDARALAARINGLFPWPATSVDWAGTPLKFGQAEAEVDATSQEGKPGEVLPPAPDALRIATGKGVLRVLRLQRPGGKLLPAGEFLRGTPLAPGTLFASHPVPSLVSKAPFPRPVRTT